MHHIETEDYRLSVRYIHETVSELLMLLPANMRYEEQIRAFASEDRQREWLGVRVLLQEMCGAHKEICYTPRGNPVLADKTSHISISHSRGFVAVMLSESHEVAIDIERYAQNDSDGRGLSDPCSLSDLKPEDWLMRRGIQLNRLRQRFLPELEDAIDVQDRQLYLTICWSAKETVYKLHGQIKQVSLQATDMRIVPFTCHKQGTLTIQLPNSNTHSSKVVGQFPQEATSCFQETSSRSQEITLHPQETALHPQENGSQYAVFYQATNEYVLTYLAHPDTHEKSFTE